MFKSVLTERDCTTYGDGEANDGEGQSRSQSEQVPLHNVYLVSHTRPHMAKGSHRIKSVQVAEVRLFRPMFTVCSDSEVSNDVDSNPTCSCTCSIWTSSLIPCVHICRVLMDLHRDVFNVS